MSALDTWYYLGAGSAPSTDQTIAAGSALRAPVAFGPRLGDPDEIIPPIVAHVIDPADPATIITTLDQAHSIRWLDQLNEPGSGSLVLQNDDPDLALVQDGHLIRCEHYGYAAMCLLVNDRTKIELAEGEEHDQTTTITGPGHLALLEQSRVYPARGVGSLPAEEDRMWAWYSVDYDFSSWAAAASIVAQGETNPVANPWWADRPEGWPDPDAVWIWDPAGTPQDAPVGLCLARHDFDVPSNCRAIMFVTVDDYGILYFDGQPLIEEIHDWQRVWTIELDVSAGPHTIAIYGENTVHDPGNNPGGILCSIYVRNNDGTLGALLDHTSSDWSLLGYPPYLPGMTPTEVIRHVVQEGQAKGEQPGVTLMFADDTDSAGNPVPVEATISTKTGTDLLSFARELTTYLDIWMAPGGLELWAWVKDGRGSDTAVIFEPGVNLTALTDHGLATPTNALLIRWHGGWHELTDPASIATHGRKGGLLGLGAAQSIDEVERIGREQLAIFADPRQEIAVDLAPVDETDRPYPAFLVGDRVTVPVEGTPTSERVVALTVAQDDDGQVSYVPELHDTILGDQERHEQALKKMQDGTMRGDSAVATPVSQISTGGGRDCCPPQPSK